MSERYTYVVVGAGSAGCVMAARLSEDPSNNVLLLEAGGEDWSPLIRIPIGTGQALRKGGLYGWQVHAEHKEAGGRVEFWPRGKVIGGSSSLNGMQYLRGHPSDFNHWRDLGNSGWGYDDILPYFLKSEGHQARKGKFHNDSGPLRVNLATSSNPLYSAFIRAGVEAGFPETNDFNGDSMEGFGMVDFTIHRGRRWSAARAFLDEARKRPNLKVLTGVHATRVLLEGKRAVGVEFAKSGGMHKAIADAEVILCAGAINSPLLLMHSGIGDARDLLRLGIQPVVNAPGVGRNLQDHPYSGLIFGCTKPLTLHSLVRADRAALMMAQALFLRSGPATSFPSEAGAFTRTRPDIEYPDIQWYFILGTKLEALRWPGLGSTDPLRREAFTIGWCQMRPESRGQISLVSRDPMAPPHIDSGYLTAPGDMRVMVDAFRQVRKVASQPSLKAYIDVELMPGDGVQDDEQIEDYIRTTIGSGKHPCGTCRMGSDDESVVDPQLRVRGVERLRVIDASITPTVVTGGLNATTIMIAEKGADLVRGQRAHAEIHLSVAQ